MYQNLKYKSSSGVIEFSNKNPIILQNIDGLSEIKSNNEFAKAILQDGETYTSSSFEKREIIIKFIIIADNQTEYMRVRSEILRVINPKLGKGELIYSYGGIERRISVVPDSSPIMPIKSEMYFSESEIVLIAPEPFLENVSFLGEEISTWIGGWKFKFSLPFRFKQRGEAKKNVYNDGHVETPLEIIFKGPAVNPSVINHATGEFIKVERELTTDDTLYITTEFGNKKVEIERNGVITNAFHYIDLDSTFFQLQVGDNLLEYTTDDSLMPQSVEVRYRNKYIGV